MSRHNIPIGRILGIPIGLDYSWFVVLAVMTWTLGTGYYPAEFKNWPSFLYWLMGALTALLLFASVLLHELGHSVVALRFGIPVKSITLYMIGGVAQIGSEPPSATAEFLVAVAGPLVSLVLAAIFHLLQPLVSTVEPLAGLAKYLAYMNFALALLNMIPGYPLDGGRVFRAALWAGTGDLRRATRIAATAGRIFGFMFIMIGVLQMFGGNLVGGLWIAFIGWFLEMAATGQLAQTVLQDLLKGRSVAQAMSNRGATISADLTLQALVDEHILGDGQHERCFLVDQQGKTTGLMTLQRLKEVPRSRWAGTRVGEVMLALDRSVRVEASTGLWDALQKMDRSGVNQVPVTQGDRVVGMLKREDVISFLRTLQELEAKPA